MASEMPTREQKLLFCFMKAIMKDICMFDAVSTAEELFACGIPCDASIDAGQKAQCLALLEFLHAKFSHTMLKGKRQKKYAICEVILGAGYEKYLEHNSLSEDSTNEEVDFVYTRARSSFSRPLQTRHQQTEESSQTCRQGGLTRQGIEGFDKDECRFDLKSTLKHNEQSVVNLVKLLDCCKDMLTAEQTRKVGPSLAVVVRTSGDSLPNEVHGSAGVREKDFDMRCNVLLSHILSHSRRKEASALKHALVISKMLKAAKGISQPAQNPVSEFVSRHFFEDPPQNPTQALQRRLLSSKPSLPTSNIKTETGLLSSSLDAKTASEQELFAFAFKRVGSLWKEVGAVLGFEKQELDAIEIHCFRLESGHKAWDVLHRYYQDKGSVTISFLEEKLEEAKLTVFEAKSQSSNYFPSSVKDDPWLVGRNGELEGIEKFFWEGKQKTAKVQEIRIQKVQVLSGVGGVGKTSLQNHYAILHQTAYSSGIFHFNSESSSSLLSSLDIIIMAVQRLENGKVEAGMLASLSQTQKIHLFHEYIRCNGRSLILFDSADSLQLLKGFLPGEKCPCHILISTRQGEESKSFNLFQSRHPRISAITSLENESAVEALLQWAGLKHSSLTALEQRFARQVACSSPVEGLPLALAHAGILMKQRKLSFEQCRGLLNRLSIDFNKALLDLDSFLRYFRLSHLIEPLMEAGVVELRNLKSLSLDELRLKSKDKLLLRSAIEKMQNKCGFLTWEMDLDDLERDFPEGYLVMSCCSLFASRRIPQEIVQKACFGSDFDKSKYRLEGGIRSLNEYSLIQEIEENDSTVWYNVHHLIQQSMVERLYKGDSDALKSLVKSVEERFLEVLPSYEKITEIFTAVSFSSLSDYISAVSRHVLHCNLVDRNAFGLPFFACCISSHLHDFCTSVNLGLSLISTLETQFGTTSANKCLYNAYRCVASVYRMLKDRKEFVKWMTKARQCKSTERKSDVDIDLEELGDRALLLIYDSHFDEAENLLLDAVECLSAIGLSSQIYRYQIYSHLSYICLEKSDYNKKLEYLEKGLELSKRFEVPEGFKCADYYRQIGECIHNRLDDPARALPNLRKALEIVTSQSEKDDLRISQMTTLIPQCELQLGRFDEALQNSERGLKIAKSLLPRDSPLLLQYLVVHADILSKVGRLRESCDHYRESLTLIVSNFSPYAEHATRSYFYSCINEIFTFFGHAGNLADLISYLEDLMAVIRDDLPSCLYFKACVTYYLARAYICTDSFRPFQNAAERMDESLRVFMKECPAGDETIIDCAYVYARVLLRLHRFEEASDLLQRMATTCSLSPPQVELFDKCWAILYQLKEAYPDCANGCIHQSNLK
eukprot:m.300325 g.300325  ORF g.300325 m.300325 type:complete len:1343 (+) comp40794_c1_seq3:255-4283(+)